MQRWQSLQTRLLSGPNVWCWFREQNYSDLGFDGFVKFSITLMSLTVGCYRRLLNVIKYNFMLSSFITLVFDTERHKQDKLCEESCRTKSSSVFGEITVDD